MNDTTPARGRKLAAALAILAILLGAAAIIIDLAQGEAFNPRPLGAVVIGLIVLGSVRHSHKRSS